MKPQITKLLSQLSRKGNEVGLADILDSPEICVCWTEEQRKDRIYELWSLWYEVGLTKSLQELVDNAEWENVCKGCDMNGHNERFCKGCISREQAKPKDPALKALLEFILSLNLTNE